MFNHIASRTWLLCVSGLFLFPFLWPIHSAPIPSFYSEWIAAVLLLSACLACLCVTKKEHRFISVPSVVLLFVVLIVVLVLQLNIGMLPYAYNALFPISILLLAVAATFLGRASVRTLGMEKLLLWISGAMIVGGIFNVGCQIFQLYGAEDLFPGWIVKSASQKNFYYGNLAQTNHLSTFLSWSLICTLYLYCRKLLGIRYVLLLITALLIGIALTGSRTSWVQTTTIGIAGGFLIWRLPAVLRPRYWYLIVVLPLYYLLITLALPHIGKIAHFSFGVSALDRTMTEGLDVGRKLIYSQAWEIFTKHPLLGIGIGNLEFHQFMLLDHHEKTLLAGSAHNLFLDLLVMTGVVGATFFIVFLGSWALRAIRIQISLETVAIILIVAVFGIHALLEFPQWYGYFLWPLALFLGVLETRFFGIKRTGLLHIMLVIGVATGLGLCVILYKEYEKIEAVIFRLNSVNQTDVHASNRNFIEIADMYGSTFFSPHSEVLLCATLPLDNIDIEQKIKISERAMRSNLSTPIIFRHIVWLAMANRQDEAIVHLERLNRLRPKDLPEVEKDLNQLNNEYPKMFERLAAKLNTLHTTGY